MSTLNLIDFLPYLKGTEYNTDTLYEVERIRVQQRNIPAEQNKRKKGNIELD